MGSLAVPPNDPKTPRWLLDLKEWKILSYTEVPKETLDAEGYGVVSYTWGYIAQWDKPAQDVPEGVTWKVPTTSKWPLSRAREVMEKIGTRYIWWDWMCVPQGRKHELDPELFKAKGEEIGKQLHIYKRASKSIVWLHSTDWSGHSAIKRLLLLELLKPTNNDPKAIHLYLEGIEKWLQKAQADERWLKSGWTLQEGVLLGDTVLIDTHGNSISDRRFFDDRETSRNTILFDEEPDPSPSSSEAIVRDLSIGISVLAYSLAAGYFIQSEGHDPDPTRPGAGDFGHFIEPKAEAAVWLRRGLQNLVRSGLVGYFKFSPLTILAGKNSRVYGYEEDSCWALVGAMELEDVKVSYDILMDQIKRRFFDALVKKSQWMMLFLPYPEFQVKDRQGNERSFQWMDIVDGVMLPVSLFLVEDYVDPDFRADQQPTVHFSNEDQIRIRAPEGGRVRLFRAAKEQMTYFRHYRQDPDGLKIVSPRATGVPGEEDQVLGDGWLLPLWKVDAKQERGQRCLLLLDLDDGSDTPA